MRFHKTPESARTTYTYSFSDGSTLTLVPGENGITELDIKELHRLDDREAESNVRNYSLMRSEKERAAIKEWTEEYVQTFEEKYGYTPNKTDLQEVVKRRFPKNWTQSLDEVEENFDDKSTHAATSSPSDDQISHLEDEYQMQIEERIEYLLRDLSQQEKDIYHLVKKNGLKKIDAGKILGISDSYVSRVIKKIEAIIDTDENLKKMHR